MTKIPVIPGIWWLEIPEAGLRILCGTPMDSIKHLIRQGLVRKTEKKGVVFETGPNAILLADTPTQNGRFWNLAEFPVLHMLFRQGKAIPGHPGNDGSRPLLIGIPDQLESVLGYIHRGTYGLTSREEMMQNGVRPDQIEELWRMKVLFASGTIKEPHELIDTIAVADAHPVNLPGGATVMREDRNRYRFSFGGETELIDMSLPAGQDWSASYRLGSMDVPDSYFSVVHIGEGNGWDPDKPCMGSILIFRGRRYLIDSGPGIRYSLESLGIDVAEIRGLFITHAHDDHFAGLTSLLRGDRRIDVWATRPVMATVRYKLSALLGRSPDFMDHLVNIRFLEEDTWNDIEGLEVRPTVSPHPLETTIMFFRTLWEGGFRSYAHLADIVSRPVLDGFVVPDGISAGFRDRVFDEYRRKADIKKIDAGRGLIHGFAEDFADDPSPRVIISHYEGEMRPADREVGSGVSFGQVDVLIPYMRDRRSDIAASLLSRSLPVLSGDDIDLLLNVEVETIPPSTTLLRQGSTPEILSLIISGTVDALSAKCRNPLRFSAGALIAEYELLRQEASSTTSVTRTHVKIMRIPGDLYVHALKKSKSVDRRLRILDGRRILTCGSFPGHVVSVPRLDEIAADMKTVTWKPRKQVDGSRDELYCIVSGSVEQTCPGGRRVMSDGSLLNLAAVLPFLSGSPQCSWTALETTEVVRIPGAVVRATPALVWTLADLLD